MILSLAFAAFLSADPVRFELSQQIELPAAPEAAKKIQLWIPVPIDADGQSLVKLDVPPGGKLTRDTSTGNRFLYFEFAKAVDLPKSLEVKCVVQRTPVVVDEKFEMPYRLSEKLLAKWLSPEPQSAAKSDVSELASKATTKAADPFAKGKALYGWVFDHMTYDKQQPGWGEADVDRACKVGKGNCTDFHGLFVALCQSQKIPARLEMGLSVPIKDSDSYHCWASFYAGKQGWVPVDVSDARKSVPDAKSASDEQRFAGFGKLSAERVVFGRGIETPLAPPASKPVRFVLSPVLEIDGARVPADQVKSRWTSSPVKE
jgi:transglutaminase-like putative cysteine protease